MSKHRSWGTDRGSSTANRGQLASRPPHLRCNWAALLLLFLCLPLLSGCGDKDTMLILNLSSQSHYYPDTLDSVWVHASLDGEDLGLFQSAKEVRYMPYSVAITDKAGKGGRMDIRVTVAAGGKPVSTRSVSVSLKPEESANVHLDMDRCGDLVLPPLGSPGPKNVYPESMVVTPGEFHEDAPPLFTTLLHADGNRIEVEAQLISGGMAIRVPPALSAGRWDINVEASACALVRHGRHPLTVHGGLGHLHTPTMSASMDLENLVPLALAAHVDIDAFIIAGHHQGNAALAYARRGGIENENENDEDSENGHDNDEEVNGDFQAGEWRVRESWLGSDPPLHRVAISHSGSLATATFDAPMCKVLLFPEDLSTPPTPLAWTASPIAGVRRCLLGTPFFWPGSDLPYYPDQEGRIWRVDYSQEDGSIGIEELLGPGHVPGRPAFAQFDPDGSRLFIVDATNGHLVVFRVADWMRICRLPLCDGDDCYGEEALSGAISPDGRTLVVLFRAIPGGGDENTSGDTGEVSGSAILRTYLLSRSDIQGDGCNVQAIPGYEYTDLPNVHPLGHLLMSPDGQKVTVLLEMSGQVLEVDLAVPHTWQTWDTGLSRIEHHAQSPDGKRMMFLGEWDELGGPIQLLQFENES